MNGNPYIYLFTREDLSPPQRIIQTAHAVDELSKRLDKGEKTNSMVLCGAPDANYLQSLSCWLNDRGIDHHMFWEPDVNEYTAIATEPLIGHRRNVMKRFKLMRS